MGTDTESDGSINEIIQKRVGKRNKSITKEKDIESELENSNKGKKKDKIDQVDNISPKNEGIDKKVMHIEKCIDNVISAAITEQNSKKVLEMKKESIMEKEVKES